MKRGMKLSKQQVQLLRDAYRDPHKPAYMTYRFLAKLHNVNKTTIYRILNNLTHVEY